MSEQDGLFATEPKYALDSNVVLSFLKTEDDEHYGVDVFAAQWQFLERHMKEGKIIAPRQIEKELDAWADHSDTIKAWLRDHRYLFCDVDDAQLALAKKIINAYPAYGLSSNSLGDLELMTLAGARSLTVLSLEHKRSTQPNRRLPKIPDVCAEYEIDCVSFPGFLRREGFGSAS